MPIESTDFTVTAHRGWGGAAPENTMGGFARTIEFGVADWIDFDVQRSRDGVLMVVHDLTLLRTSNVSEVYPDRVTAEVGDFTVEELQRLDVGAWFTPGAFAGEVMPTFAEALDFLAGKVGITFELKHPGRYPDMEAQVAEELRRHGLAGSPGVKAASFEHDSLRRMHDALPELALGAAFRRVEELRDSTVLDIVRSVSFSPQHTAAGLELAKRLGLPVGVGGNSVERMRRAIEDGVRRLSSDYPDVLGRVIRGESPFSQPDVVTIEEVEIDAEAGVRIARVSNAGDEPMDVTGWYLWNGVHTHIDRNGPLAPGETRAVVLTPLRGRDASSVQTLALHDAEHSLRALHEFWAVPRPVDL